MTINETAFQAFMTAYHENGPTGLGMRKSLEAYEAAKKLLTYPESERAIEAGGFCLGCGQATFNLATHKCKPQGMVVGGHGYTDMAGDT